MEETSLNYFDKAVDDLTFSEDYDWILVLYIIVFKNQTTVVEIEFFLASLFYITYRQTP